MNSDLDELAELTQALKIFPPGEERDRAEKTAEIVRGRVYAARRRDQAMIDRIGDVILAEADAQRWHGLDIMDFFDQETAKDRYWVDLNSRMERSRQCLDAHFSAQMNLISRKREEEH